MAGSLNKFVVTATVQIAAGTVATVVAGEPGTGGAAGFGNTAISAGAEDWPTTITEGTAIVLDSGTPSALYTALNTAGVLRAYVPGQDDVGHAALSNLGGPVAITAPSVPASGTPLTNPTGDYASVTVTGGTSSGILVSNPSAAALTAPAVPASTGTVTNTTGNPVAVAVSGGTVTVIAVNGSTIYTATGNTVVVPPGGTVGLTYSVAPTWTWTALSAGVSGNPVASPYSVPVPPGCSITLIYSAAPSWAWANPIDLSYTPGYYGNNSQAEFAGWNPYTALPYAQHATLGTTALATGVSN